MAALKDFVEFLISEYPRPEELTRGRLEKLVYLADVDWAWRKTKQLSDIDWIYNDNGPFVGICDRYVQELQSEGKIKIHVTPLPYTGDKEKTWYEWLDGVSSNGALTTEEETMFTKIIQDTFRWPWGKFCKYVYATPPMAEAKQYAKIDIEGEMQKRRKEILDRAREKIHRRYREDFQALAG